ncbi:MULTISPECIES: DUF6471 domain-containing protein [Corallincola]|uniref:DUF6471 domain-containing protein n=2 Tax=Corallincola TaxID=1775176 RepID=A0ABY1WSS1_9GAMM|nr:MULTISPECIES: DUF6471 domain-containing protein [Corallincola]TAA47793.1 hypothetical protein EXY25_00645 [Corallincola spongiicola]TCI02061.1 hypothetical protein EZV61_15940 [Corallincola luteus]
MTTDTPPAFDSVIKRLVRTMMAQSGMTYAELSKQLYLQFGTTQLDNNLRSKVNKGKMSADLFIQILSVCKFSVSPEIVKQVIEATRRA